MTYSAGTYLTSAQLTIGMIVRKGGNRPNVRIRSITLLSNGFCSITTDSPFGGGEQIHTTHRDYKGWELVKQWEV